MWFGVIFTRQFSMWLASLFCGRRSRGHWASLCLALSFALRLMMIILLSQRATRRSSSQWWPVWRRRRGLLVSSSIPVVVCPSYFVGKRGERRLLLGHQRVSDSLSGSWRPGDLFGQSNWVQTALPSHHQPGYQHGQDLWVIVGILAKAWGIQESLAPISLPPTILWC